MHELYLAQCIIRNVKKVLPEQFTPERVTDIRVKVGKLDAVVKESVEFLFNAIKLDEALPNAALTIVEEDVKCCCTECGRTFELDTPIFVCATCGSSHVEVVEGRGLTIVDYMISDEEPEHADPDFK